MSKNEASETAGICASRKEWVEFARSIRAGNTPMPRMEFLRLMSKEQRELLNSLVFDDVFFDFMDSTKDMSNEQVKAIRDLSDAMEEYDKARDAYIKAEGKRIGALRKFRSFEENGTVQ